MSNSSEDEVLKISKILDRFDAPSLPDMSVSDRLKAFLEALNIRAINAENKHTFLSGKVASLTDALECISGRPTDPYRNT